MNPVDNMPEALRRQIEGGVLTCSSRGSTQGTQRSQFESKDSKNFPRPLILSLLSKQEMFLLCLVDASRVGERSASGILQTEALTTCRNGVGTFMVEAMLSQFAPIFYGDIGSHERVPILFSTFIGFCKKHIRNKGVGLDACFGPQRHDPGGSNTEHGSLHLEDVH
ncbi:hypothetical protein K1719_004994 [Acacia pycnantha]|nr:hypothetical protein K1719_004994 [Acacia pycnantha]